MLAVRQLQHAQGAGYAHSASAHDGLHAAQGLAVFAYQFIRHHTRWCGLASVKGLHLLTIKVNEERTAAQSA